MTRFLIAFFSIYSLLHAFVYSRVKVLLPVKWPVHLLLILFMALMVFAPIGTRLLERGDHNVLARASALLGYGWLGFVFYSFWGFLLLGVAGILCKLGNLIAGSCLPTFTGSISAVCVLAAAFVINVYGYFEARCVRVERIVVKTAKLPVGVDRLRIAQISDVHLGLQVREERMADILRKVEAENPDILVSTGDLVDGDMEKIEALPALFGRLRPRLGKYAITGNHEFYAGLAESLQAERAFGFTVLSGEVKTVDNILNIVGVDDPATGLPEDEKAILGKAQNGLFTLFLKHRPDPADESLGLFDLQLSGHTHYGQLFPFRYISGFVYPLQNGPYYLSKGSILYTSRGSGTWGPPIRVLAPPEVTIFDIVRE
jgi:predicted MPP superfamily phosphohydrolase